MMVQEEGRITEALAQLLLNPLEYNKSEIALDAPEMPPPGPSFQEFASLLNPTTPIPYVSALYSLALYKDWFTLDILYKGGKKKAVFVPGHAWSAPTASGPVKQAKVMIIGKMPNVEEIRNKRNFSGKAGKLLLNAFELAGVTNLGDFYVTNLLKFTHLAPQQSNAIPVSWIKDCKPLLHMELRLVKPDYILCLGSEAGKELLGSKRGTVNNAAGSVFDYHIPTYSDAEERSYHSCKVMVCIHPTAVALTPELGTQLNASIRMFSRLISGESIGDYEKDLDHIVVETEADAIAVIDRMYNETASGGAIAVDCEWEGEHPGEPNAWLRTIQLSHKPKFAVCFVIRQCGGEETSLAQSAIVKQRLVDLFKSTSGRHIRAIGHFHRADLPWLIDYGVDLREAFEAPADVDFGWEQTKHYGGFDTGTAAHAVCETDEFKLELLAVRYTGIPRYDIELQKAKAALCTELKIGADDLNGYGLIPSNILYPYALFDVDATRRLFDVYNGVDDAPGRLDLDDYGNNSRMAFWVSMRASPAFYEMERTGLLVDIARVETLIAAYCKTLEEKSIALRKLIDWPNFNHKSPFDCRELLFGVKYRGQVDKVTNKPRRASPLTAKLCSFMPIKATGKKTNKSWEELELANEASQYSPATDKETLGILFHAAKVEEESIIVGTLRDIKFLGQLLQTTLRPPVDVNNKSVYEKGLLSWLCIDKRIRTHIYQTLETGRCASARPNLQNQSKRREADYKRILGQNYICPIRSIFIAPPGHVLVEADYVGAELAGMAWMSGDPTMIEHVRRAQLPEKHPDYYDIHSAVAVNAFRLNCEPTKDGLESIGMLHLRVAAKNVVFGYAYGRGAEAIQRQAKEEGVTITVGEAQLLINGLIAKYPMLPLFFSYCRQRVNNPRWICNPFGRFRRFIPSQDRKVAGEQERQAMNFDIQSLVADAVSRALDFLYIKRKEFNLSYKIALQIHDAVLLEVPVEELEFVYDEILPLCMTKLVPIYPCNLDGQIFSNRGPYNFGIDKEVYLRWGEKITSYEDADLHKIPYRFVKKVVQKNG